MVFIRSQQILVSRHRVIDCPVLVESNKQHHRMIAGQQHHFELYNSLLNDKQDYELCG